MCIRDRRTAERSAPVGRTRTRSGPVVARMDASIETMSLFGWSWWVYAPCSSLMSVVFAGCQRKERNQLARVGVQVEIGSGQLRQRNAVQRALDRGCHHLNVEIAKDTFRLTPPQDIAEAGNGFALSVGVVVNAAM